MFSPSTLTPLATERSATIDELERRYLALHQGDREAAARSLSVDLMMLALQDPAGDPEPGAATTRRLQRAAVIACGVLRLPMTHAMTVYEDTVEYVREHLEPATASGGPGRPITPWEAAALTTRRAA